MHSANRLADTFQALVDCYRSAEDEQDRHTMDVIASRMSQAAKIAMNRPPSGKSTRPLTPSSTGCGEGPRTGRKSWP